MPMQKISTWKLIPALALTALSSSVLAIQPGNSNIEYIRPADLGKPSSFIPGSAHGHVRQKLGYGKGYRYGHGVNGPMGDIIIWSPAPNHSHGVQIIQPRSYRAPRTSNLKTPQLRYKPEYGKISKPDYGD